MNPMEPEDNPPKAPQRAVSDPVMSGGQTASRAVETTMAASDGSQPEQIPGGAAPGDHGGGVLRDPRRRRRNRRRGRKAERSLEGRSELQASDSDPAFSSASVEDLENAASSRVSLKDADPSELFGAVVSGEFDEASLAAAEAPAAPDSEQPEPARRVLAPEADAPKLHKVLAQSGVGSRRDLEQMIADGRVTVNGQAAHTGQRISYGDKIAVDGKPVKVRIAPQPARVLAYHKPAGEVVTHDDPQQRPTVFRRLPRLFQGKWQSVGRLDINTEGLLLFTNSGDLANRLMHPRFGIEREYAVRILGSLSEEGRSKLLEGVEIDGQTAAFKSIEDGGGDGANRWVRVVITEGRNREVRKLFDAVGHAVSRLIRIRYGSVVLPKGLRRGVWVDLPVEDVKALRLMTSAPGTAAAAPGGSSEAAGQGAVPRPRGKQRRGSRRAGAGREFNEAPVRSADFDAGEPENFGPIPNPLQQTYDKRAIQQARRVRDIDEDGPIPNPLQQTYDRRAVQAQTRPRREVDEDGPIPNPLQQTYDKRFVKPAKVGPGAPAGRARKKPPAGKAKSATGQPDPMRTSVGYIGADAFHQKAKGGRSAKGGRRR